MTVKDDFFEEVITTLGGTLVDVELVESDIDICFRKAKRVFKQKGHNSYRNVFLKLATTDAVDGVFNLPPMLDTIVSVLPTAGTSFGTSGDDIFNQMVYQSMFGKHVSGGGCNGASSTLIYELQQQQMDTLRRRMTGGGIAFVHDPFKKTLKLLSPTNEKVVVLDAYYDLDDEEYMEIDWVIRWTIAEAKHMLGTAYRKFSGIAAPTGETSLAGQEYISEAKEDKNELLEEIENYVDGSMDYGQITIG